MALIISVSDTIKRSAVKSVTFRILVVISDAVICEIAIPVLPGIQEPRGSGVEDLFSKTDFERLLVATGNPPDADFATLSNNEYMKKHPKLSKWVVAMTFYRQVDAYQQAPLDAVTQTNARRVLDFCFNGAWFLLP